MPEHLRFTGRNPPPELWRTYPNWRNAYEEEGKAGQDETTLMPHEVQTHISEHTSFTGGMVRLNNGHEYPAFLAILGNRIEGCQVYEHAVPWRIYYNRPQKKWVSFRAEWLPEAERPPCVRLEDESVFPLKVFMLVPWVQGGVPSVYQISSAGQLSEMTPAKF